MIGLVFTTGPGTITAAFDYAEGGYRNLRLARQEHEGQVPTLIERRDLSDEEDERLDEELARACERKARGA